MINTVVFDLDGTLLDTLDDLMDGVNYAMARQNFKIRTKEEVRTFVGNGIKVMIERAVPKDITEKQFNACYNDFCDYYKDHMEDKTHPYDGILDVLKALKNEGIKTAIVTNKADFAAQTLCRRIFGESIDLIVGSVENRPNKPAPDGVLYALDTLKSSKENAIFVGDSDVDIKTAHNAELPSIGVLWGFRDRDVIEEAGAKYIVNDTKELLELIISLKK